MITGRWGANATPLLDITVADDGSVTGIANPGRENAVIRSGRFDQTTGALRLEGEHNEPGIGSIPFVIEGKLEGRTLALRYEFGDQQGEVIMGRVEEYRPRPLTLRQRLQPYVAAVLRRINARTRPSASMNARRLMERGETLDSIVFRDAMPDDIPALAELHVTTWNATYSTTRGPTIATRARQWTEVFEKNDPRSFILVLENRDGRLIGFAHGKPDRGAPRGFTGQLSKIYLRWEYHGLGLGRRMMEDVARRFLARGIESFCLFAELSNPTLGFYDRMGGERLVDEHGRFHGAYGWRDVRVLMTHEHMIEPRGVSGAGEAVR